MKGFVELLVKAIIYVIPAYIANATPVITVKLIGSGTPLDMGLRAWDGRRVLGDGKTVEGLISGTFLGTITGIVIQSMFGVFRFLEPFVLSLGAMLGDIIGAFLKRRMGLKRGEPMPVLDQLGFLAFSLLLAFLIYGAPGWMRVETLLALALITALLHIGMNAVAYVLGLKDKPY